MTKQLRVLIVDDSVLFRSFMRRCLNSIQGIDVIGTASDGKTALSQIEQLKPDLVTLDMPIMHGIEVLRGLQEAAPETRVIVVSSDSATDAEKTIEALEAGAGDFIIKPETLDEYGQAELVKKLMRCLFTAQGVGRVVSGKKYLSRDQPIQLKQPSAFRPDIIAIGSSTGGPAALSAILSVLPGHISVPLIITQHMPKLFVQSLAARLNQESQFQVQVAEDGLLLEPGQGYIAPGEIHLEVVRSGVKLAAKLVDGPKIHHCKPSVDHMFHALVSLSPGVRTLAVVLTGMGVDGADGAKQIADAGGYVIAQDEASSAVWGMPGSTVRAGAANEVLPLNQIAEAIARIEGGGR